MLPLAADQKMLSVGNCCFQNSLVRMASSDYDDGGIFPSLLSLLPSLPASAWSSSVNIGKFGQRDTKICLVLTIWSAAAWFQKVYNWPVLEFQTMMPMTGCKPALHHRMEIRSEEMHQIWDAHSKLLSGSKFHVDSVNNGRTCDTKFVFITSLKQC